MAKRCRLGKRERELRRIAFDLAKAREPLSRETVASHNVRSRQAPKGLYRPRPVRFAPMETVFRVRPKRYKRFSKAN